MKKAEKFISLPDGYDCLLDSDVDMLLKYSKDTKLCIDIGTFVGVSAAVMASNAMHVITIDIFEDLDLIEDKEMRDWYKGIYEKWPHSLQLVKQRLYGIDNIAVVKSQAHLFAKYIHNADTVFVDGDHTYKGCSGDFFAFFPSVKVGGTFIFHDYEKEFYGVSKFVYELANEYEGVEFLEKSDVSMAFKKVSDTLSLKGAKNV